MTAGIGEVHRNNIIKVGETVHQGTISAYIHDKCIEKDAPNSQTSYVKTEMKFNTLSVVVLMYGSKIEDLLRHQNNTLSKQ